MLIMDTTGNLYGTAGAGGAAKIGRVFELAKDSRTIGVLASFVTNGANPGADLIRDSSGNMYGRTNV
jgi:uncharacterized repeat protein (TIGR03803 family)